MIVKLRKKKELKENNLTLGYTDVSGEGVEVTLEDATSTNNLIDPSMQIIHYVDIQM